MSERNTLSGQLLAILVCKTNLWMIKQSRGMIEWMSEWDACQLLVTDIPFLYTLLIPYISDSLSDSFHAFTIPATFFPNQNSPFISVPSSSCLCPSHPVNLGPLIPMFYSFWLSLMIHDHRTVHITYLLVNTAHPIQMPIIIKKLPKVVKKDTIYK